ncbi:L-serine ammonia-lyase [Crenobacter cavernae]|uniref:L-serine dehydratase n=1 Tax=Crenobacter cavernae TaxID=2290923 RepID=A0ABY0FGR5_9NEIS|nr:L-serine ammonia-lyase [Crenobacter cavernae]RXZ45374.1 L-serine ammonia-lyase [Crenobacter cavernae]
MISIFDLFSIGIGPSSSHTVGPMKAAHAFSAGLDSAGALPRVVRVAVGLYGSLALTGEGHGTVDALLLGLEGEEPQDVAPAHVPQRAGQIRADSRLVLDGKRPIAFDVAHDVVLNKHLFLPKHANGLTFAAYDAKGATLAEQTYYSVGGGFIVTDAEFGRTPPGEIAVPYPFKHAEDLLEYCRRDGKTIAQIVMANEAALGRSADQVRERALAIARVMKECVEAGCRHDGLLPGGLHVRRRAPPLYRKLAAREEIGRGDIMLWPMLYAIAVNEENAAGGRVVTAPTNGAAGVVPSVLTYYRNFHPQAGEDGVVTFLLTAGAIGLLYKMNASISGAEVGCQGEVGVACSMAAGAYAAVLGGNLAQIENAAEIAMEHQLGMTCDPVGGLVQIPCIERNGVAAEQAIKVAQLALLEDGEHKVSLDTVIRTMLQTGLDMKHSYKETSLGGLAITVSLPEC